MCLTPVTTVNYEIVAIYEEWTKIGDLLSYYCDFRKIYIQIILQMYIYECGCEF